MPANDIVGLVLLALLIAILAGCAWIARALAEAERISRKDDQL